jgi:hypothetical protein
VQHSCFHFNSSQFIKCRYNEQHTLSYFENDPRIPAIYIRSVFEVMRLRFLELLVWSMCNQNEPLTNDGKAISWYNVCCLARGLPTAAPKSTNQRSAFAKPRPPPRHARAHVSRESVNRETNLANAVSRVG